MLFSWLRRRRRKRLLSEAVATGWEESLRTYVWQYKHLPAEKQRRLSDIARVLIAEKNWSGCGGLELTGEMQAAIAGRAALMVVGPKEPFYFDRLSSILVYPAGYEANVADEAALLIPSLQQGSLEGILGGGDSRLGEAWGSHTVVLAWQTIQQETGRSRGRGRWASNLVLHEFAHHIDALDGEMDGIPPMFGRRERQQWRDTVRNEFEQHRQMARRGQATLIDTYGATKLSEFFAVSTECFFEQPYELREQHTALYEVLQRYYQQDPTDWIPPC